jgi:uncharacterized protein
MQLLRASRLAFIVMLIGNQPPAFASESVLTDLPETTAAKFTLTGIPLDAPWKVRLYGFARKKLLHPAWGWTHSERDYALAFKIAASERLRIDSDVLFAAAFTHDIGAVGDFQKEGVDHAVRSAELAKPLLLQAGFPAAKWPAVEDAILGHMHDKTPSDRPEAVVLHDADTLDFLGYIGVARRLAVTGNATDYGSGLKRISDFADKLPTRLVTRTAKSMAQVRTAEMQAFLFGLNAEAANGRLP